MKSLKRTLSLVLSLVMVLGLFGGISMTAAATDFTDDEEIQYKEAVDVMTAIGAIKGRDNGEFDPDSTITRAEAATLVARTVLGYDVVENDSIASSFSDVSSAYSWAIPSIEYLVKQGVIDGMGDGTFHPGDPIEGYAVLKMLLCSIGYGAKDEYTGDSWKLNVAIDASREGSKLTEGLVSGVSQSSSASREEVALYCFNAIQAGKVRYLSSLDTYIKDTGTLGSSGTVTIMNSVYPDLDKADPGVTGTGSLANRIGEDAMGNPATLWAYEGKDIGTYPVSAVVSYNTAVIKSTVAAALKGYTVDTTNGIAFTMNGSDATTGDYAAANNKSIEAVAGHLAAVSGNGTLINVYANTAGQITAITVVQRDTAVVSAVSSSGVTLESKNNPPLSASYTIEATDDLFEAVSGLAAGDLVVVTPVTADGTNYVAASIDIPTQITGKLTVNMTAGTMTVDGTTYGVAAAVYDGAEDAAPDGGEDATLWLDPDGFIINVEAAAAATAPTFAFVVDAWDTLSNGRITHMAKVVYTDGTIAEVTTSDDVEDGLFELCTITGIDSNGVYTLDTNTSMANAATSTDHVANVGEVVKFGTTSGNKINASDKTLTASATGVATNNFTNYYSANVKFIYISGGNVTVLDGVQNVTLLTTKNGQNTEEKAYVVGAVEANSATDSTPVVTAVFLPGMVPAGVTDTSKLVYVPDLTPVGETSLFGTDEKWHKEELYSVYINGEAQTLALTEAPDTADVFYLMTESTTIPGAYTLSEFTGSDTAKVEKGDIAGIRDTSLIKMTSGSYTTTGATVIDTRSSADKTTKPVTATPAGLAAAYNAYANVTVTVLYDPADNSATQIYLNSVGAVKYKVSLNTTSVAIEGGNTYSITLNDASGVGNGQMTVTIEMTGTIKTSGTDALTVEIKSAADDSDINPSLTSATGWSYTNKVISIALNTASLADLNTFTFNLPAAAGANITITGNHTT